MAPNKHIIFPLGNVEEIAQLVAIPYGELFRVSMNRWNGNVVLAFQDHPEARFFIRMIVAQLSDMVDMFDEEAYRSPNSGLIDYEDEGHYEEVYGSPPRPRQSAVRFVVSEVA